MNVSRRLWTFALLAGLAFGAAAEPTPLGVYVISRDAKFIGTSMGGVQVSVTDARTGELLAQGITEGATGDTEVIMREPWERMESRITPEAAAFSTTIDLDEPRQVKISAYGPLDYPDSANTVTATQWLLPGKAAEDWVLEMPGLVVKLHDVPALVQRHEGEAAVPVQATVMMMCGCPLTPDGLWDANEFEIEAQLLHHDTVVATAPLAYAGEASEFRGELAVEEAGEYRVRVTAFQARTGNAGSGHAHVVVDSGAD